MDSNDIKIFDGTKRKQQKRRKFLVFTNQRPNAVVKRLRKTQLFRKCGFSVIKSRRQRDPDFLSKAFLKIWEHEHGKIKDIKVEFNSISSRADFKAKEGEDDTSYVKWISRDETAPVKDAEIKEEIAKIIKEISKSKPTSLVKLMKGKKEFCGRYLIWPSLDDLTLRSLGEFLAMPNFASQCFHQTDIPGVTSPWIYIGLEENGPPCFAIHIEVRQHFYTILVKK